MNADGTNLRPLKDFIGGHPEWLDGQRLIGTTGQRANHLRLRVDASRRQARQQADYSPNRATTSPSRPMAEWFVNGYRTRQRRTTMPFCGWPTVPASPARDSTSAAGPQGDLRVDPSPNWNRARKSDPRFRPRRRRRPHSPAHADHDPIELAVSGHENAVQNREERLSKWNL